MKINEIFERQISPEGQRRKPKYIEITSSNNLESKMEKYKGVPNKFENKVIIFLFKNRKDLGISKIYRLKNCRVDALLKLDNGDVILAEFKYALNWVKVCNARVEFQDYFAYGFYKKKYNPEKPPTKALIVFDNFSKDWEKNRLV